MLLFIYTIYSFTTKTFSLLLFYKNSDQLISKKKKKINKTVLASLKHTEIVMNSILSFTSCYEKLFKALTMHMSELHIITFARRLAKVMFRAKLSPFMSDPVPQCTFLE